MAVRAYVYVNSTFLSLFVGMLKYMKSCIRIKGKKWF